MKSGGTVPVPVRELVCGEPDALSATESEPLKLPVAEGVNVTAIVQLVPGASVEPHAVVSAKSLGFIPVRVMPEIMSEALPPLLSVNVCVALVVPLVTLPKLAVDGVRVACGAAAVAPAQLNAMDCCCVGEGKFAPRLAVWVPAVSGVQVIEIVQIDPAARLAPQVLVSLNELVLLPKNPKLLIVSAAVPEFCSVAVCVVLVLPMFTLPKLIIAGVSTG